MNIIFIFVTLYLLNTVHGQKPKWHSMTKMDNLPASLDLTEVIKEMKRTISHQIKMSVQNCNARGDSNKQFSLLSTSKVKQATVKIQMKDFIRQLKKSINTQIQLTLAESGTCGNKSSPIFTLIQPMIKREIDAKLVEVLADSLEKAKNDILQLNEKNQQLQTTVQALGEKNQQLQTTVLAMDAKFDEIKTTFGQSCSVPANIQGTTHTTDGTDSDGNLKIGGHITYTCTSGHVLSSGDLKRTCSFGSFFSGQAPMCKEKPCEMPAEVVGASRVIDGIITTGKVIIGGTITYTCKDGFYLDSGDLERKCNLGPLWTGKAPVCKEDCKRSIEGYEYEGKISKTENDIECQNWELDYPHSHDYNDLGAHNLCRNPDGEPRPWCYTIDPNERWDFCDIPTCTSKAKECKETTDGVNYFGTVSKTKFGKTCQKWTSNYPHTSKYTKLKNQQNYCRNPYKSEASPWCYTTDNNVEWELCDIPDC